VRSQGTLFGPLLFVATWLCPQSVGDAISVNLASRRPPGAIRPGHPTDNSYSVIPAWVCTHVQGGVGEVMACGDNVTATSIHNHAAHRDFAALKRQLSLSRWRTSRESHVTSVRIKCVQSGIVVGSASLGAAPRASICGPRQRKPHLRRAPSGKRLSSNPHRASHSGRYQKNQ